MVLKYDLERQRILDNIAEQQALTNSIDADPLLALVPDFGLDKPKKENMMLRIIKRIFGIQYCYKTSMGYNCHHRPGECE